MNLLSPLLLPSKTLPSLHHCFDLHPAYSALLHLNTKATHSRMAPSASYDAPSPVNGLRPHILVPEKLSPDGLALLTPHFDVDNRLGLSAKEVINLIPNYHGLIVRSETQVTAEVLQAGRKLKVVARAGVGVDNIDVSAATAQGIIVINSPAGNILAAAEHTITLLLATARHWPCRWQRQGWSMGAQ